LPQEFDIIFRNVINKKTKGLLNPTTQEHN
jgi:hypothetical protein